MEHILLDHRINNPSVGSSIIFLSTKDDADNESRNFRLRLEYFAHIEIIR